MTQEVWKPTHHEDYHVSNLGRVKSFARYPEGRLLQPGLTSAGYPSVSFGRNNTQLVHRLVAAAFIGPCPEGQECRHKDDDRTNPREDNLVYGTRGDNVQDMWDRNPARMEQLRMRERSDRGHLL